MELFSPKIIENLYSTREISKLGKLKKRHLKKFVIFREIELSSPKLNKLLYFRRELAKPKKPKKSTLKKFIIFFQSKVLLKFWNDCWSCRDIKIFDTLGWLLIKQNVKKILILGDDCWFSLLSDNEYLGFSQINKSSNYL